jgi:hypothetical protein
VWEFIKENSFVVGALSGSLAAYLLGLLVSHWRRERRWLGYSVNSRNIVQHGHTKLSMLYDGKQIVRLDSHSIAVRNIGNRPLLNVPVQIQSQGGGAIVEHELRAPDGASCSALADSAGKLVVTTDLINPGEVVTIGLTVADSGDGKISVNARGELLEVKEIGDRFTTDELLEALLPMLMASSGGGRVLFELYRVTRKRRN